MVSYAFLALAVLGACLTLNAHFPIRGYQAFLFPSFIAGWIVSEAALQNLALQVGVVAALAYYGALEGWPGWVALGLTTLSWAGMIGMALSSWRATRVFEPALAESFTAHALAPGEVPVPDRYWYAPLTRSHREVKIHRNLRYAEGAQSRHLLDVYTGAAPRQNAPVVLQIHGGGWFTGDKSYQGVPLMLHLTRCGFVCVASNYRLSPRATFPEHLIDVKLALAWVREHVAEYGGDPAWIAITGGSAGGHLAALAALTPGDPEYQPGFEHVDTSVRACVPFYGVYDFTDRLGTQLHGGLRRMVARWILKRPFDGERDAFERASPMSRVTKAAPPFFVIHGTHDNLASTADARHFVALLRERSPQPVVYAELPGAHHAFEIFHSARTGRAVHAVTRFLKAIHARDQARDHARDQARDQAQTPSATA